MKAEDKVIHLVAELLDTIDQLDKVEDKRKFVSWVSNVWQSAIKQIAAYTAVKPEMRAKAREGINTYFEALRKTLEEK